MATGNASVDGLDNAELAMACGSTAATAAAAPPTVDASMSSGARADASDAHIKGARADDGLGRTDGAASLDSETAPDNPSVGDRVQVEWLMGQARGVYAGVVDQVEWTINSFARRSAMQAFSYRYHVVYDDGDRRWETVGDTTTRLSVLSRSNKAASLPAAALPTRGDVGRRLSVYWPKEDEWFAGVLTAIEAGHDDGEDTGDYHVLYDDGDEQWEPLGSRTPFRWADEQRASSSHASKVEAGEASASGLQPGMGFARRAMPRR